MTPKTPIHPFEALIDEGRKLAENSSTGADRADLIAQGDWGQRVVDQLATASDPRLLEFPKPWTMHGLPALRFDEVQAGLKLLDAE